MQYRDLVFEAVELLGRSPDLEPTLDAIAAFFVPRFASFCAIDVLREDGAIERLLVVHEDPAKAEVCAHLKSIGPPSPKSPNGVLSIVRRGKAMLTGKVDEAELARGARSPEHLALMLALEPRSGIVLPMRARGEPIGVIWVFRGPGAKPFEADDLPVAEKIALCAAIAIDRASLLRHAREAVAARDDFLSVASHELKTPLTSLSLQLEMLERTEVSEKAKERLRRATLQVERVMLLVHRLLDVSRAASGPIALAPLKMDLSAAAREIATGLEEDAARASCELVVDAPAPVMGVWDAMRIEQVIYNLLTNALKYGRGKPVRVSVREEGTAGVLAVEDQGIGIARANHSRIFRRFERVAPPHQYGGLGLGLWIADRIVTASGGKIEVESDIGKGARFVVVLPKSMG